MECVLVFGSVHRALKAESVLKKASRSFKLLPAPKALAAYCDLVISIKTQDLAETNEVLKQARILPRAIYKKEGEEYVKV